MDEPILVFDDDCGFCTWWAEFVEARSDARILGYTELTPELRARLPEDYEECSHFLTEDRVYSCGASIEEAISRTDVGENARPMVEFLRNFRDYERVRERAYSHVSNNRATWGKLMSKTPPVRREDEDE